MIRNEYAHFGQRLSATSTNPQQQRIAHRLSYDPHYTTDVFTSILEVNQPHSILTSRP